MSVVCTLKPFHSRNQTCNQRRAIRLAIVSKKQTVNFVIIISKALIKDQLD